MGYRELTLNILSTVQECDATAASSKRFCLVQKDLQAIAGVFT
jgi:hypothetical protein